ncbi:hypothetical protein A5787_15270 [Mycobacterium sp. 852002-50816_SCH5313054-b]|uniref:DUF1295 domain-containing protein n=1 Tax=Mycobacterium sp. 852002-50816_SCH5313054-b TaxID=1834092 RepID=UPI0007FD3CAF|nr:DUF1295 domain-containing protein [Mycobacterium sp. 852002-50816_SCH5313054-b]OBF63413.1 hypothetical protein A5787_15270 [Mycobacterium sp. 852002-50816_SCH5313054-b]
MNLVNLLQVSAWIGRYNVVDVAWGVGFVAIAAVAATLGRGDAARRWLLLALVAIWGLRLAWHIQRKTAGTGEGPRYAALLRGATVALGAPPACGGTVRKVFVLQAFIGWWALATVGSPVLMTYFMYVSGARLTEKLMAGRPGFDGNRQRAAFFFPRPPRSASR